MSALVKAIFKYVSQDRIDILTGLQIRFTQPSYFNDPFEARASIDGPGNDAVMRSLIDKSDRVRYRRYSIHQLALGRTPLSFDQFNQTQLDARLDVEKKLKNLPAVTRARAIDRGQRFWDDSLGILSLSATENSLLMWAHYTDSHKGMLLQFAPKHPFFNPVGSEDGVQFGKLLRVNYSAERPRHRIGESFKPEDFLVKSMEWSYEQEWRVFRLLEESDKRTQTEGGTVHLFNVPPASIRRVVMGCRMDKKVRQEVINAIRSNPKLHHVKIHQAEPHLDVFALNYVALEQQTELASLRKL